MTDPSPTAAPAAAVRADGIRVSFGRTHALDGVSLGLSPGVSGLLGPNGAGKTTLLRLLATVASPDAGRLEILGRDPASAEQRLAIRRRLGYMPQEPGFHRAFSAFEFVDYVAILKELTDRRTRHAEVRRVLELVGLSDQRHRRIRALSGGMRRRVALAQALLGDPELLVLDEPTAGLDPEQRLRFRQVISGLGADRVVLLSTHQTEDVAALCRHVVVLHRGRVRFTGSPRQLAGVAQGRVWRTGEPSPGARVSWRTGDGRFHNLGQAPPGATPVEPTLEDGYMLLIGDPTEAAA